ncbi:MAG: metalloregulator ArsR/SmtB family transcription factor [Candidatus Dormibacteraeota bacterium]|nr:metalloregulator ArsR/SmtB family transcription factor [Candidatus Dormibacteraeota bacterium]
MQPQARISPPALDAALAVLSNPRRRDILQLIWTKELSAGEIAAAFDVSWPATSQNLRLLKSSGLVNERRAGTRRLYSVNRDALGPLEGVLTQMWQRDLGRLKRVAEREASGRRRSRA